MESDLAPLELSNILFALTNNHDWQPEKLPHPLSAMEEGKPSFFRSIAVYHKTRIFLEIVKNWVNSNKPLYSGLC